jgi:hypothetical protein
MGNLENEYDIQNIPSSFQSGLSNARTKTERIMSV